MALEGRRLAALLLGLASVYTLLNALKPLHVDDTFTWYVARQIAAAPLDPFGFDIYWYQWPQPTHEDLLAPVLPYWGALGLLVAGSNVFAWKLWLLPFALLFAWALHRLARRFAPGLEIWVVAATLFGPAFLPSMNYMQDVPAIALGLCALALYLDAAERRSVGVAIVAGLVAGLAMQTKWTQLSIPAAIALHGLLTRRIGLALVACAAASTIFLGWEAAMTLRYGHGMFLFQLGFPFFWMPRIDMAVPLLTLLGALLPAPILLALAALGVPRAAVLGAALLIVGGWALLLGWPVDTPMFLASGAICALSLVAFSIVLLRRPATGPWLAAHQSEAFLVLWLAGEVVTYFTISYFPAVRRVLMTTLVATLLAGRVAALARGRRALPLAPLLALQVLLGVSVWGVDLLEARAQRHAAEQAAARIRAIDPDAVIWYTGHWGFQYYAEAVGMKPLIPDHTLVHRGEWIVSPLRVDRQEFLPAPGSLKRVDVVRIEDPVRLSTLPVFYIGGHPLQHFRGRRSTAIVQQATTDFVPESAWTLAEVADWAMHAGGDQATWAVPALLRHLEHAPEPEDRVLAAQAIAALGPQATTRAPDAVAVLERAAATDPAPPVRAAAKEALARVRDESAN